jgi:RNA polymerase sigma factor (sigma-70 family)
MTNHFATNHPWVVFGQKTKGNGVYCVSNIINNMLTSNFSKNISIFMVICHQKLALTVMEAELDVLRKPVLRACGAARDVFFEEMYERAFPAVASFVRQMNGSFQDAKDIFQDALIIYFERSAENGVVISVSPERYILGISKHLWSRKFKEDRMNVSLDDFETALHIPADFYPSIRSNRILQFLEVAGSKCMDLLRSFYFEKHTLKDVSKNLGYSTEHSAAVQKYKCLEKIRESIKEKSVTYEDFFE